MTTPAGKTCVICGTDVTSIKRVKDAQGNYYCASCHQDALAARRPAGAATAVATARSAPAAPVATIAPAPAAMPKLPARCPSCGTPVFSKSVICVGCRRDMTKMDALAKIISEAAPNRFDWFAEHIGRFMKWGFALVILGIIAFAGWGAYTFFNTSSDPFARYPMSRAATARQFLTLVGNDSADSQEKAYLLININARPMGGDESLARCKTIMTKMDQDFETRYGKDWQDHMRVVVGPNDRKFGPDPDVQVFINDKPDPIIVEVAPARSLADSISIMSQVGKGRTITMDDGKTHWGVIDVADYPFIPPRKINLGDFEDMGGQPLPPEMRAALEKAKADAARRAASQPATAPATTAPTAAPTP